MSGFSLPIRTLLACLLLAVSAGTGLIIAEIGVRAFGLTPPPGLSTVTESEFARVPGLFTPGQQIVSRPDSRFEHLVSIDSLGYRGAPFPRSKPPGEVRVIFAGDSFTWGHNVNDWETLPAQLEVALAEACGSATVINAGLSGSTILAQSEMIRRSLPLDPDIAILMFYENDIFELAHVRLWESLEANRRVKSRPPLSFVYPIARRMALWRIAQDARRALTAPTEVAEVDFHRHGGSWELPARAEYEEHLRDLRDFLYTEEVPLLFLAFPSPDSVRESEPGSQYAWAVATAMELGIETLSFLEPLKESGKALEGLYLVPDDYHPSPEGHALAAGIAVRTVLDRIPCG